MAKKYYIQSDLTGKEIKSEDEMAQLRVLDHPELNQAVVLDAGALEIAGLKDASHSLVTVEVVLPDGSRPDRLLIDIETFNKLFKNRDPMEQLSAAEEYLDEVAPAPKRRGRPAGSGKAAAAPKQKRDPELLKQIRGWARENGWPELGDRGRIPYEAEAAWEEAHKN